MTSPFDFAKVYYWRVQFIEPRNPDDNRYVMLHGERGELIGPMTPQTAESWMDRFDRRQQAKAAWGQGLLTNNKTWA